MAKRRRSGEKAAFWREAIARQATSGLSVRAFCRNESLSEPSFYSWRRVLVEREGDPGARPAASSRAKASAVPSFVSMMVEPPVGPTAIVLELAGGHVLKLPPSTPESQLVELVLALVSRGNE